MATNVADSLSTEEKFTSLFARVTTLEERGNSNIYLNGSKLSPGDTIILACSHPLTETHYKDIKSKIEGFIPGVTVILVHGVSMTVMKNGTSS